jgi:hypothetical protein
LFFTHHPPRLGASALRQRICDRQSVAYAKVAVVMPGCPTGLVGQLFAAQLAQVLGGLPDDVGGVRGDGVNLRVELPDGEPVRARPRADRQPAACHDATLVIPAQRVGLNTMSIDVPDLGFLS